MNAVAYQKQNENEAERVKEAEKRKKKRKTTNFRESSKFKSLRNCLFAVVYGVALQKICVIRGNPG